MVISQPTGIILHIIIVLHQRCTSIALNASRDYLMFYTCNYISRVTHRNGAIKHIFTRIRSTGGIISRLFFILFVAPCACSSSAVKILHVNLSYERFEHVNLTYIIGCIFSRYLAGPHFVTQPILLSENIPNI